MEETMTKRKFFIVGFVLATIACAVPFVAYVFRDPINQSNFELLQEGMTEADVVRILGRACDDETMRPLKEWDARWDDVPPHLKIYVWQGRHGQIHVGFNEAGTVNFGWFLATRDPVLGPIRRWLGADPDPSHMTPLRIHRRVGPASSSI
jgi:hypothetical protein